MFLLQNKAQISVFKDQFFLSNSFKSDWKQRKEKHLQGALR